LGCAKLWVGFITSNVIKIDIKKLSKKKIVKNYQQQKL